jgi:predicted MFS family arabinose efflux permease
MMDMVAEERTAPVAAAAPYAGHGAKPYRAYVLGVLMVIYAINLLDRGLVGLLQEKFKPEFHLSDFELGLLGGPAFALCNALAGLPLARLAERFNRIGVLSVCVALWSIMTACCGLAVSFPMLLLARFGVGIGEAGCLPPTQSVIADYFPANKRASAISIHLTSIPIGTIAAAAIGGVVADLYGWRMAFVALGAPGILIALICWLTVKEPPRGGGQKTETPNFAAAIREVMGKASFWHIALATGLVNFVAVGNGQYVVSFMIRVHHISLTKIGLILGPLVGGLTVVSVWAVGKILSHLTEKDRAWLARWPGIGVAIGVPVSVMAYLAPSIWIMVPLQMVGLLCTNAYLISLYTTAQGVVQPRVRATATAMVIMVVNVIGYGVGPPAIGALSDFLKDHVVAFGLSDPAHAAAQGLRYALVCGALVNLWASAHYLIGSTKLEKDWVG